MFRTSGFGSEDPPNTLLVGSYQAWSSGGSPVDVHSYCGFMVSMTTTGLETELHSRRTSASHVQNVLEGAMWEPAHFVLCGVSGWSQCSFYSADEDRVQGLWSGLHLQHFSLSVLMLDVKPTPCMVTFHVSHRGSCQSKGMVWDVLFRTIAGSQGEVRKERGDKGHLVCW